MTAGNGITWKGPVQHVIEKQVGAAHIDRFGHVNNACYIDWAMECAWEHTGALGLSVEDYRRYGVGVFVRENHFTYLAAAHEGDVVVIGTRITVNDGKLRLGREFELWRPADGKLLVTGETLFATVDLDTGRPVRMPEDYARLYAPAKQGD